jgi:hypothetical protein
MQRKIGKCLGAIVAIYMMAAQISPATAFTLLAPTGAKFLFPRIEKVWWCRWGCGPSWGWRRTGWGYWGPGAFVGGLAAGAVVGAAVAAPGPCWRRWIGPYGGVHWARVC